MLPRHLTLGFPRCHSPRSVATNIFTILAILTVHCNLLDASNLKTRSVLLKPDNSSSFSPEILNCLNVSVSVGPSTVLATLCYALCDADILSSRGIRGCVSPPYKTGGISWCNVFVVCHKIRDPANKLRCLMSNDWMIVDNKLKKIWMEVVIT
jgi:hypothetical protein